MAGRLHGKVALVTGSGQSIGRAIAIRLAEEGAAVVTNSRGPANDDGTPTAKETTEEIVAGGGRAVAVFADVATVDGAGSLVTAAIEQYGALDILVNNAGYAPTHTIDEMTEEQWDAVLDTNLKSMYATCRLAVPHMRERGYGRILNVISGVGLTGAASMTAYAAAKAGGMGFTFALAKEVAGEGITVNCLSPVANTVRAQRTAADRYARTGVVVPASANRTPEHVAPLAAHLVSDAASAISGQIFYGAAGVVSLYAAPTPARTIFKEGRWTQDELDAIFPSAFGTELAAPVGLMPPT